MLAVIWDSFSANQNNKKAEQLVQEDPLFVVEQSEVEQETKAVSCGRFVATKQALICECVAHTQMKIESVLKTREEERRAEEALHEAGDTIAPPLEALPHLKSFNSLSLADVINDPSETQRSAAMNTSTVEHTGETRKEGRPRVSATSKAAGSLQRRYSESNFQDLTSMMAVLRSHSKAQSSSPTQASRRLLNPSSPAAAPETVHRTPLALTSASARSPLATSTTMSPNSQPSPVKPSEPSEARDSVSPRYSKAKAPATPVSKQKSKTRKNAVHAEGTPTHSRSVAWSETLEEAQGAEAPQAATVKLKAIANDPRTYAALQGNACKRCCSRTLFRIHRTCFHIVNSKVFSIFIVILIMLNTIVLGLDKYPSDP